jgi:hypothetical protein
MSGRRLSKSLSRSISGKAIGMGRQRAPHARSRWMSRGLGRMQCRILEALEPSQHHRWLAATIPTCTSSSPQRSMIWSVSAPTCASKTPPASEIAALVRSRSAAVWKSGLCTRSPNGINPARRPSALASREGSAPCSRGASSSGVQPCPWWPGMRTTFPASASVSRDRSEHPSHGETPARSGSCGGQNPDN